MSNVAENVILPAYNAFMDEVQPLIDITDEESYEKALAVIEKTIDLSNKTESSHYGPLIHMLADAIEKYEMQDDEIAEFHKKAMQMPTAVATLRLIMDQHGLTGSDLPEIGGRSMVSQVLKGSKVLTLEAITAISKRFSISPKLFFD